MTPLERRLLELGFISGEQFEIVAEAWPGRDPFVVRVGNTTLALRRREAESVWVELSRPNRRAHPPRSPPPLDRPMNASADCARAPPPRVLWTARRA